MQAAADIPLLINSPNSSSERRVSPAWTIAQFKTRLEPVTGIPASSQRLTLRVGSQELGEITPAAGNDEESTQLATFPLQALAEIYVHDTRPPGARENFSDLSGVEKYTMSSDDYEARTDSVLAWKKKQQLGRFDPNAPELEQQKIQAVQREVEERHIEIGKRCQLLPTTDGRRGTVAFVGPVPEIPGTAGPWIGIKLDEPTGKNEGGVGGVKYFECPPKHGVFVRPDRVEVGAFPVLNELDEDMEEI